MQKFIGNIVVAAGTSVNNLTTAVPFDIPVGTNSCIAQASGADCYAEMLRGTSALTTTATTGESIGTSQYQLAATPTAGTALGQSPNVLCVYNNSGSSRTIQVVAIDA